MYSIAWNQPGDRGFEAGLDRGVLYPESGPGVPWNGLISVNEDVAGGDLESYYFDGVKFMDFIAGEDFQATIEAFMSPPEFDECDGNRLLVPGLYATRQPRKTFGLSYRTLVGNDTRGIRAAFKLHLVYNLTAQPASKSRATLDQSITPANFQWTVTSVPPLSSSYKPTAHFEIDSRSLPADKMAILEAFLYGHMAEESLVIDGGSPDSTSPDELDGGTPSLQTLDIVDGGDSWSGVSIQPTLPPPEDVIGFLSDEVTG